MNPATFLVVLPTYDEADNVIEMTSQVLSQDPRIDILVVDDNSPDGTGDLVERAAKEEPRIRLLRRAGKLGLGTAYLAGFRYGLDHAYDCVITMDCDFSHNPKYLPTMIAAMGEHDLVIGSRYVPGGGVENWPAHRRALSKFANFYARALLGIPTRDCTAGFRCYRSEVLSSVEPFEIRSSGYSFLEEMAWRVHHCGFRIGEIPILFEQRKAGASKIDSKEIYRAAWTVLVTALRPPKLPDPVRRHPEASEAGEAPAR